MGGLVGGEFDEQLCKQGCFLGGDHWRPSQLLPQLPSALGVWLTVEAAAGRIADDHRRSLGELVVKIGAAFGDADAYAGELSNALSPAHNLSATLHAVPGS